MSNFTFNYCHNFILFARSNKQQWESQNNLETRSKHSETCRLIRRQVFFKWSAERSSVWIYSCPGSERKHISTGEQTLTQQCSPWSERQSISSRLLSSSSSSLPPPSAGLFLRLQRRVSTFLLVAPPLPRDSVGWKPRPLPVLIAEASSFVP